jgi:alpha-tubulin suppressor-like RCC1 family protein
MVRQRDTAGERRTFITALLVIASLVLGACGASKPETRAAVPTGKPAATPIPTCPTGSVRHAGGCSTFVQLALGAAHSCALTASGDVWCWGQNQQGQLGDGTRRSSWQPVRVQGLNDVLEVKSNRDTNCARTRQGRVSCWGSNRYGQGAPTPTRALSAPKLPARTWCSAGEPSNFEPDNVLTKAAFVPDVVDSVAIAVGAEHSCSLARNGAVTCWGDNSRGQLAGEVTDTTAFQRSEVFGLPHANAISAAGSQTCAIADDKSVWCWGGCNEVGQLGTAAKSPTLRQVPRVTGAESLSLDSFLVCAKLADGLMCWGDPAACYTAESKGSPTFVRVDRDADQLVRANEDCSSCVLTRTRRVNCTFMSSDGNTYEQALLSDVRALASGEEHACAIIDSGGVACWGPRNSSGQLGRPPSGESAHVPDLVHWEGSK